MSVKSLNTSMYKLQSVSPLEYHLHLEIHDLQVHSYRTHLVARPCVLCDAWGAQQTLKVIFLPLNAVWQKALQGFWPCLKKTERKVQAQQRINSERVKIALYEKPLHHTPHWRTTKDLSFLLCGRFTSDLFIRMHPRGETTQDRWSPQWAEDGRWWSARSRSRVAEPEYKPGTADHGGTEIHVGLLNNDHHQPGFVLAFSTNYCSTGRHSSLWRQKHRLCKEQRRGCVFTLMLTGAQTDRHHSSQHSHFDLFMVVIVVTVCVPSRITLPLPCFYITVSLLSTCDTSQTIHELQGCWPSRCQVQPEESHHRCKGRLQAEASQSFQGGDPIIYKL